MGPGHGPPPATLGCMAGTTFPRARGFPAALVQAEASTGHALVPPSSPVDQQQRTEGPGQHSQERPHSGVQKCPERTSCFVLAPLPPILNQRGGTTSPIVQMWKPRHRALKEPPWSCRCTASHGDWRRCPSCTPRSMGRGRPVSGADLTRPPAPPLLDRTLGSGGSRLLHCQPPGPAPLSRTPCCPVRSWGGTSAPAMVAAMRRKHVGPPVPQDRGLRLRPQERHTAREGEGLPRLSGGLLPSGAGGFPRVHSAAHLPAPEASGPSRGRWRLHR